MGNPEVVEANDPELGPGASLKVGEVEREEVGFRKDATDRLPAKIKGKRVAGLLAFGGIVCLRP